MPRIVLALVAVAWLGGCEALPILETAGQQAAVPGPPVRFLLTFDDGPSAEPGHNTTAQILDTLARNRVQKGIKAIFFVQSRHPRFGGSPVGQHVHTATPVGHVSHVRMSSQELDRMLEHGIEDIHQITGDVPDFTRPPFWSHNALVVSRYEAQGLTLLLDDITLHDGKSKGYTYNLFARERARRDLRLAAQRSARGEMPSVSGYIPLVVTLHDPNPTTARRLEDYLEMLIDEAQQAGLRVQSPPFLAGAREIVSAASARRDRASHDDRLAHRHYH